MRDWRRAGLVWVAWVALLAAPCRCANEVPPADSAGEPIAFDLRQESDSRRHETEVVSLAYVMRLTGSDPVLQPLMPWPREAEDGFAAIRDDWPASSWKAPAGSSHLVLDLIPWTGQPVPLETLSLQVKAPGPESLAVYTAAACTDKRLGPETWTDLENPLVLSGKTAGCLWIEADSQAPYTIDSLDLLVSMPEAGEPPPLRRSSMNHPASGVVEGFYGVPWSWRERAAMLHHLANLGLGVYIYAPKHDPRHRALWREHYPDIDMARFGELGRLGESLGIDVMVGISPFVDWGPDEAADYLLLVGKLRSFQDAGVGGFVLLADDIEFEAEVAVDGAMGQAHAAIVNQLLDDLRIADDGVRLWFVPTVYSDERADQWAGGLDYLAALADISAAVEIMWTGPGTSNAMLEGEEFDRFVAMVGRAPVLWENYWANDGGDGFVGRLPLAPYAGRAPSVAETVTGIVANPLIQGGLSRLAVTSAARFLDDPNSYSPAAARAEAAAAEMPFSGGAAALPALDSELLMVVQSIFDSDTLGSPGWHEMEAAIGALTARLDGLMEVPIAEVGALLPLFARLMTLTTEIHNSGLAAELVDELHYPLRKVRHEGEAGLYALLTLGDRLAGETSMNNWSMAKSAQELSMFSRFMFSWGKVDGLLSMIEAIAANDLGFVAPVCDAPIPPCLVGVEMGWTPCLQCAHLRVFGLPGAEVDDNQVRWLPTLPGVHDVVATCIGVKGWAAVVTVAHCSSGAGR